MGPTQARRCEGRGSPRGDSLGALFTRRAGQASSRKADVFAHRKFGDGAQGRVAIAASWTRKQIPDPGLGPGRVANGRTPRAGTPVPAPGRRWHGLFFVGE